MASIFLSYARADADKAERIARSLEASGHSVWWDQRIDPGSVFSAEIDTAIGAADLVVVLWSASSIVSNWVKDEASVGRDNGRLVPVLIEPVQPPLGFRQYQAIDLSRSVRKLDLLHAAVARKLGEPPDVSKPQALGGGTVLRRWWLWAAAGLAMLLIGIWLFFLRPDRTVSHVVAVIAAEGGDAARSQELARTMAADLGRYRAGPLSELTLLGGSDVEARDADYRVEVGVISAANDLRADVSLLSPQDSKILWTTSVDGRADRFVDLRQQAVAKLGEVLNCAVELGDKRRSLQPEILGLYLNGCGRMNDILVSEGDETARSIFRQITQRVPDFAPAWAKLALIEVQSFPGTPPPDRPALAAEVQEHLKRARELDPTLPEVIAANAYFHPNDGTKQAHALAVLDQGLKQRPDSALLHGMRSYFLRELGRLNEA